MKKLSAAMHREMLDGKTRYCFLGGSNARVVSIQRGKLSCFSKGTANMRQLQDTFDRYLSSLFKARAAQLAVKLIEQKAAKLGLTLSRKQKRGIFKKLEKGKASEINLHFRHIPNTKVEVQ